MMLLKKTSFGLSVPEKVMKICTLFCFSGFLDTWSKPSNRNFSSSRKTDGWEPVNLLKVNSLKIFSRTFYYGKLRYIF